MVADDWSHLVVVACADCLYAFFFCNQKTAYEVRIRDWSSDVCSSDPGPLSGNVFSSTVGRGRSWSSLRRFSGVHAGKTRRVGPIALLEIGRASCRERVCQYV